MDCRYCAAFFALIKTAAACLLPVLLLTFAMSGCADQAYETQPMELMPRDSNTVSHGTISRQFPRITNITIDIDRRIYAGTSERTDPNHTFGLVLAYGQNRRAAGPATTPGLTHYYKAILSSADDHFLRCDFTGGEGGQRDGLCVDDFRRVYDVTWRR